MYTHTETACVSFQNPDFEHGLHDKDIHTITSALVFHPTYVIDALVAQPETRPTKTPAHSRKLGFQACP